MRAGFFELARPRWFLHQNEWQKQGRNDQGKWASKPAGFVEARDVNPKASTSIPAAFVINIHIYCSAERRTGTAGFCSLPKSMAAPLSCS
jgi:hypothetical protein